MKQPPTWKPEPDTRIAVPGICFMHGGPTGMQLPEHEHSDLQMEAHFTSGVRINGRRILDSAPSFMRVIPSGQPHTGRWDDQCEVVVVLLSRKLLNEAAEELLRSSTHEIAATSYGHDPVIHSLSRTLRQKFKMGWVNDLTFMEAVANRIAEQLVRRFSVRYGERAIKGRLMPWQLRLVLDCIESQLGDRIGVGALADQLGIGSHQFTHHFRAATGSTPYQFILEKRIERARTLLKETNMGLAQIAHELGFVSQSHFNEAFRRATTATPRRFRLETKSYRSTSEVSAVSARGRALRRGFPG